MVNKGFFRHRIKGCETGNSSDGNGENNGLVLWGKLFDILTHGRLN
jgi:hypothetical protein